MLHGTVFSKRVPLAAGGKMNLYGRLYLTKLKKRIIFLRWRIKC